MMPLPQVGLLASVVVLGPVFLGILGWWFLPKFQVRRVINPKDRLSIELEHRKSITPVLGGAAILVTLLGSLLTYIQAEDQSRQKYASDLYEKGVASIMSPDPQARLIAVNNLTLAARYNPDYQNITLSMLSQLLRTYSRNLNICEEFSDSMSGECNRRNMPINADIQAAVTAIGEFNAYEYGSPFNLDLSKLNLNGANLSGAHLQFAKLARSDLGGANLTSANLSHADLDRTNMSYAIIDRTDFRYANMPGALFFHATTSLTYFDDETPRTADFRFSTLEGAHFSDAHLCKADFDGARVSGADLRNAYLFGANLSRANFFGADFTGAQLGGADFTRTRIDRAKLVNARLAQREPLEAERNICGGMYVVRAPGTARLDSIANCYLVKLSGTVIPGTAKSLLGCAMVQWVAAAQYMRADR